MNVEFVDTIPVASNVLEGRIYVSLKYKTSVHRCACGCSTLVPLPISPQDWSLSYDGENITLYPSVGNGALSCKSHYYIRNGKILWLPKLSNYDTRKQQTIDASLSLSSKHISKTNILRRLGSKFHKD